MAKIPRMPFPSFTLVLSRQEVGDNNESNNGIQQRNTSNRDVEPPVDLLMKTFDPRLPRYDSSWKMRDTTDEDRSDTETVFEERIDIVVAANKGSIKGSRKRNRGLNNLSEIFRMLKCYK